MNSLSGKSVQGRVSFSFIRYANCWEDADVLCEALKPCVGKRILSIASAGDNSLALAAEGADVVAADLSLPQLACLELRCAAFRRLDYGQTLDFLGVRAADNRPATYSRLRADLSPRPAVSGMGILRSSPEGSSTQAKWRRISGCFAAGCCRSFTHA